MYVLDFDEDEDALMFEVDADEHEDARVDAFWREVRARAEMDAVARAPAVRRWIAWLRVMWWRVDPQIHLRLRRLRLRVTRWSERVDWPLVATGLFAFARSFVGMMLLVLREMDYHFLPQLRLPFELPRDSYLARLQTAFRICMIEVFRLLFVLHGLSGVIAALIGLRIDVRGWRDWDLFNLTQEGGIEYHGLEPLADQPQTVFRLGGGHQVVIRGRVRWVPLLVFMVLMIAAVFLFNPTTQAQETHPT